MSEYYSVPRKADWNYGGKKWRLSRSKIALFQECPRCFYLDNKLGLKRPPGYPFNLNSAVDRLLKTEFDAHRVNGEQHPLQKQYGLQARPAPHELLDIWRDNFKGVEYLHKPSGLLVSGAIDDLWIDDNQNYIVVDYKATAKSEPVTELNDQWHEGYKRQMEVYQWLLRRNEMTVSDTGYFVYCTGRPDEKAFDAKVEFDVHLIPYTGSDEWVDGVLKKIKKTLDDDKIPVASKTCDYCVYRQTVHEGITNRESLSFGKRLSEKFDQCIDLALSKGQKGEPAKKFSGGRERFFNLLKDHPFFQKRVKEIREKYEIPPLGYDDSQDAYHWEHGEKSRYHDYVSEIDSFVLEFNFPKVYLSSVKRFVYDFVLSPNRTAKSSIMNFPIFSLVKTDEDREINKFLIDPSSFYIQVFDWTTKKDVTEAWEKISKTLEENSFQVSRVQAMARRCWLLSQEYDSHEKIRVALKGFIEKFGDLEDQKIPDQSNIALYIGRYKEALNSLRKLD